MSIGKPHTLCSQAVDVRGGNFSALRIVALDIPVTQVIGVNDEDVRPVVIHGIGQIHPHEEQEWQTERNK